VRTAGSIVAKPIPATDRYAYAPPEHPCTAGEAVCKQPSLTFCDGAAENTVTMSRANAATTTQLICVLLQLLLWYVRMIRLA
jgi:hypothetical protein